MFFVSCFSAVFTFVLSLYKYILRILTGKGEIERILSTTPNTIHRTNHFERAIEKSKTLRELVEINNDKKQVVVILNKSYENRMGELVEKIVIKKKIRTEKAKENLKCSVQHVMNVHFSVRHLEQLAAEAYNPNNLRHEQILDELWNLMKPMTRRAGRITADWQELGFQGHDPATDFRGMGILGLLNLHYFATKYGTQARSILTETHDPKHWYSFAIAGINFTGMLLNMIRRYQLNAHFYTVDRAVVGYNSQILDRFNELYSKAFMAFHQYWRAEKATVMDFNSKKDTFFSTLVMKHLPPPTA